MEFCLNVILILFLFKFIKDKYYEIKKNYKIKNVKKLESFNNVILKTLGFTYLNPHVYSDTVFILGNLSKNFALEEKFYFAFGASFASIIFFYSLGYFSSIYANFIKSQKTWKNINIFIILFMLVLVIFIIFETFFRLFN